MISQANMEQAEETEQWVTVGRYTALDQAYDHALVVLAMGEACRVVLAETPGEYELHAELLPARKVSEELEAYGREMQRPVPPPPPAGEWRRHPAGGWLTGIWVLALIAVYYWQDQDASLVDRAASSSVGLIGKGEWWRPFTALFLHADLSHLVGNLTSGVVFATLVSRCVGPLLGWALILGSGTVGNAIVSRLTYPEPFVSLGASAAVFAALGILTGCGVAETLMERARLPWLRIAAPFLAGIILLGWLGGGGSENTDVLGHVCGFGTGLVAGMATGLMEGKRAAITA